MKHLFDMLGQYAAGDIYPYHMPGHKRRPWGRLEKAFYQADITEIEGFDNLHHPEGILLELQQRAARLYGAEESHYLVNGSTGGILCAVSSALPSGGHILMARNCHRSAYHGAYLRNLKISYLCPPCLDRYGICDAVTPEQVKAALERETDIGAVLIVSPSYEGRTADVGAIARVVHQKGIPLIVDEAHGAHFGLAEGFPPNSCQLGADIVVHSVHKTLPSLTQTALLHVNGGLVDRSAIRRFLNIYQTSSPSYLLMASIDNALQYVETWGRDAFLRFRELYGNMMEELAACRYLDFPREGQDVGKLLISVKNTEITGSRLYHILLQKYHLQLEMAAETFALAMFTVNDREEAYVRMTGALLEIDAGLAEAADKRLSSGNGAEGSKTEETGFGQGGERAEGLSLAQAWDMPAESVALEESAGRQAGEFINFYPPGTPLLVPGETITEELCRRIEAAYGRGLHVQGIEAGGQGKTGETKIRVKVLKERKDT